ncbi:MAG: hypothetical protein U0326_33210 [Polyangiales bacterium]
MNSNSNDKKPANKLSLTREVVAEIVVKTGIKAGQRNAKTPNTSCGVCQFTTA